MRCEACGATTGVVGLGPREEMALLSLEPVQVGYFACSVCWLVWKAPMPEEATLKAYYQNAWQSESSRPAECYVSAGQFIVRSTKAYRDTKYAVALDFGTRNSAFLDWLKEGGWFSLGRLETMDAGSWGFQEGLQAEIDLLVCTHVLEHVLAPRELLVRLKEGLAMGGILYVEVPALEGGARFTSDNIHAKHLWHFSLASLLHMANSITGLSVIGAETDLSIPGWPVNRLCCRRRQHAFDLDSEGPRDLWRAQTAASEQEYRFAMSLIPASAEEEGVLYGATEALFRMLRLDETGTLRRILIVDLFKAGQSMAGETILHPADILPLKKTAYVCTRNWCSVEPIKAYLKENFPHIEVKTPFFPEAT